jgi:PIN domain
MFDSSRALVLDANILIRAVLGKRVRSLIEQYATQVFLCTPDLCFVEADWTTDRVHLYLDDGC